MNERDILKANTGNERQVGIPQEFPSEKNPPNKTFARVKILEKQLASTLLRYSSVFWIIESNG